MATAFLKIANDAFSPLASSITNVESTLTVATGDGNALFPSSFPFHVTIGTEILACTNRTADVLTVTRGVQSTSGAAHAEGEQVELMITAKHVDDITTAVNTLENSTAELLADGSRALTGAWDMGSQALTNVNIDSGAIDGAIIGANSAAAITGTTVDATTDFTVGATVITDGVITDATGLQLAAAVTVTGIITGSDTTAATAIATASAVFAGGVGVTKETFFGLNTTWNTSEDSAAVADQVSVGRYEIGAGNTVLAISQETVVVTETDETKVSHKVQMRINGVNYFVVLMAT